MGHMDGDGVRGRGDQVLESRMLPYYTDSGSWDRMGRVERGQPSAFRICAPAWDVAT